VISFSLRSLARRRGLKKVVPLARFLDFGREIVNDWFHEHRKMCLDSLLVVCARLETTPMRFLTGKLESVNQDSRTCNVPLPPKRQWIVHDFTEARRLLAEAFQSGSGGDSIKRVCERAGVPRCGVARRFPDIVSAIKERRRQFVSEARAARIAAFIQDIKQTISRLRSEGRRLSRGKVAARLDKRGTLRGNWGRTIFERVISEENIP
jgi:hypothetical protein